MDAELKVDNIATSTTVRPQSPPKPKKTTGSAIVLIPQPSDDPNDPLNWAKWKKIRIVAVVSLAAFSGGAAASAGQLAYIVQAPLYGRTALELSYTASTEVSAQNAGLAVGPLFTAPLAYIFGRNSLIFWSLLCALGCCIWSLLMTNQDDYIPFLVSRVFSGVSASLPTVLGSSIIMDTCFLHERGFAFLVYSVATTLGTNASSTFGGFIVGRQSWTVCFWWPVPLLVITAIFAFLFLEETHFDRDISNHGPSLPKEYMANRVATFLPGTKTARGASSLQIVRHATAPILVGLSPAVILTGVSLMIIFGWALLIDILLPLFLQTSIREGGYGFTSTKNAAFSFAEWAGLFAAQGFGSFYNDAFPLWICKRYKKGIWAPELRLYCLWLSILVLPIGLGISGAALEHHYHYMVLALGVFLIALSALLAVPIAVNYAVECFIDYATECTIAITIYRLGWGIAIPFYIAQWEAKVRIVWVFGMAAFFTLAAGIIVLILVWKGATLRRFHLLQSLASTEAGIAVA